MTIDTISDVNELADLISTFFPDSKELHELTAPFKKEQYKNLIESTLIFHHTKGSNTLQVVGHLKLLSNLIESKSDRELFTIQLETLVKEIIKIGANSK